MRSNRHMLATVAALLMMGAVACGGNGGNGSDPEVTASDPKASASASSSKVAVQLDMPTAMPASMPALIGLRVTNQAKAIGSVDVKFQFSGSEVSVERKDAESGRWVALRTSASDEGGQVVSSYSAALPTGAQKQDVRVTTHVSTGTLSMRAAVEKNGKTLARDSGEAPIKFASLVASPSNATLPSDGSWTEIGFTLVNTAGVSYPAVTLRSAETCYGPNTTNCTRRITSLNSVYRLQWRDGSEWKDLQPYVRGWGAGGGTSVNRTTVITTFPLPARATKQIQLRIAATSALAASKAEGEINLSAFSSQANSSVSSVFVGASGKFSVD